MNTSNTKVPPESMLIKKRPTSNTHMLDMLVASSGSLQICFALKLFQEVTELSLLCPLFVSQNVQTSTEKQNL